MRGLFWDFSPFGNPLFELFGGFVLHLRPGKHIWFHKMFHFLSLLWHLHIGIMKNSIIVPLFCKTCFSTSEWFQHSKNYLVKLQKIRECPPLLRKISLLMMIVMVIIVVKIEKFSDASTPTAAWHNFARSRAEKVNLLEILSQGSDTRNENTEANTNTDGNTNNNDK